jgi:hypothetical protein
MEIWMILIKVGRLTVFIVAFSAQLTSIDWIEKADWAHIKCIHFILEAFLAELMATMWHFQSIRSYRFA